MSTRSYLNISVVVFVLFLTLYHGTAQTNTTNSTGTTNSTNTTGTTNTTNTTNTTGSTNTSTNGSQTTNKGTSNNTAPATAFVLTDFQTNGQPVTVNATTYTSITVPASGQQKIYVIINADSTSNVMARVAVMPATPSYAASLPPTQAQFQLTTDSSAGSVVSKEISTNNLVVYSWQPQASGAILLLIDNSQNSAVQTLLVRAVTGLFSIISPAASINAVAPSGLTSLIYEMYVNNPNNLVTNVRLRNCAGVATLIFVGSSTPLDTLLASPKNLIGLIAVDNVMESTLTTGVYYIMVKVDSSVTLDNGVQSTMISLTTATFPAGNTMPSTIQFPGSNGLMYFTPSDSNGLTLNLQWAAVTQSPPNFNGFGSGATTNYYVSVSQDPGRLSTAINCNTNLGGSTVNNGTDQLMGVASNNALSVTLPASTGFYIGVSAVVNSFSSQPGVPNTDIIPYQSFYYLSPAPGSSSSGGNAGVIILIIIDIILFIAIIVLGVVLYKKFYAKRGQDGAQNPPGVATKGPSSSAGRKDNYRV